jgi:hypothetical protein
VTGRRGAGGGGTAGCTCAGTGDGCTGGRGRLLLKNMCRRRLVVGAAAGTPGPAAGAAAWPPGTTPVLGQAAAGVQPGQWMTGPY